MATAQQIDKWRRALRATFPIVGGIRRRGAIGELEARREEPDVVAILIESLGSHDVEVAQRADAALRALGVPAAVDALCGAWAKGRDERLGAIIAEKGYVASQPPRVRILTALKCGKRVPAEQTEVALFLLGLLGDNDRAVRDGADGSLRAAPAGAGRDALGDEAIKDPAGAAAKLCRAADFHPGDHERNCLYLFVTRQLDAYFQEDFEFQALRLEYDRCDEAVKGHVMDVVRSGDRRCAGFFVSGGGGKVGAKPLADCADNEVKLALDSWVRHAQWDKLFHACLELPLKYTWAALDPLRKSGWSPGAPDLKSLFGQVLADSDGQAVPQPRQAKADSSVFEGWLVRGRAGELAGTGEAELRKRLESGTPPEAVAAVAALAGKARPGSPAAEAVGKSPHWLVRLAGQATGLTMDLARDSAEDDNWWMKELATAGSVLEFWPGRATPTDLEALAKAPREAWAGRLGAARKVLRTIMAYRITTGDFISATWDPRDSDGEFEPVGNAEFADEPPKKK